MAIPMPEDYKELMVLYEAVRVAGKACAEAELKYLYAKRVLDQANAAYDKRQRELRVPNAPGKPTTANERKEGENA